MTGAQAGLETHPKVLQSLPRGGYDAILTRAIHQYLARQGVELSSLPLSPPATITSDTESDLDSDINNVEQQQGDSQTDHLPNPPNALPTISIKVHPNYRSRDLSLAETMQNYKAHRTAKTPRYPRRSPSSNPQARISLC